MKFAIAVAVVLTLISWAFVISYAYKSFFVKRDIPSKMTPDQIEFMVQRCTRKKVGVVSEINIYPVKSTAQVRVSRSAVSEAGLLHDRGFMVTDAETGSFLSQRENSLMALIRSTIRDDGQLQLGYGEDTFVLSPQKGPETAEALLWEEKCSVVDQGDEVASWLSRALGQPVRLVTASSQFSRPTSDQFAAGFDAGFTDGFPFLLVTEASMAALNTKLTKGTVSSRNFRPNIVVSDCSAWAEDQWSVFRIGSVLFQAVKPCSRCKVTAVDPATGEANKFDTLSILNKFRKGRSLGVGPWGETQMFFGQNLVAHNEGHIQEGDAVEVLLFENWDKIVGARADLRAEDCDPSAK